MFAFTCIFLGIKSSQHTIQTSIPVINIIFQIPFLKFRYGYIILIIVNSMQLFFPDKFWKPHKSCSNIPGNNITYNKSFNNLINQKKSIKKRQQKTDLPYLQFIRKWNVFNQYLASLVLNSRKSALLKPSLCHQKAINWWFIDANFSHYLLSLPILNKCDFHIITRKK